MVWGIQKIFNTVTAAIHYITEAVVAPTVDVYHVAIPDGLAQTEKSQYLKYQSLLMGLLATSCHLKIIVIEADSCLTEKELATVSKGAQSHWQWQSQVLQFHHFSNIIEVKSCVHIATRFESHT
eukprot:11699637-Ditylum_brightwellii.AAC.1